MAFTYCTNCGEKIDDSLEKCPHCNHPKGVDRVYGYTNESYGKTDSEKTDNAQNKAQDSQGKNPWENQSPDQNDRQGNLWEDNRNQGEQNPWNNQNGGAWNGSGGKNPWEGGQSPYGQSPYGQSPYGQSPYGQSPYGQSPYGQNGQGGPWQNPYGRNGDPYGRPPYNGGMWQPRERRKASVGLIIFSIINILFGTCCAGSIFGIIGLVFALTARDAMSEEEEIRRKKISLAINIIAVILTVVFIISFAIGFWQAGGLSMFMPQQ